MTGSLALVVLFVVVCAVAGRPPEGVRSPSVGIAVESDGSIGDVGEKGSVHAPPEDPDSLVETEHVVEQPPTGATNSFARFSPAASPATEGSGSGQLLELERQQQPQRTWRDMAAAWNPFSSSSEAPQTTANSTKNADVNLRDGSGKTALMRAAEDGDVDGVEALLENWEVLNVDIQDLGGEKTALMLAAERGHVEIVKALLEKSNVDVNRTDLLRRTALMRAARMGKVEVVEALLKKEEVLVDIQDGIGRTALDMAKEKGYDAIVQLLEAHTKQS